MAGPREGTKGLGEDGGKPTPSTCCTPPGLTLTSDQVRDSRDSHAERKVNRWESLMLSWRPDGEKSGETTGAAAGSAGMGVNAGGGTMCADAWVWHPCSRCVE